MKPFVASLEDMRWTLAQMGADTLPGHDAELVAEITAHFAAFAEGEIAPLDEAGDQQGCRLEDGRVLMPTGFAKVYADYAAAGWPALSAPEAFGGQAQSALTALCVTEVFAGACHSLQMVVGLVPGATETLLRFGSEAQQAAWIPRLVSGEWLATMCITEPEAGSDLSRIRCRAVVDGEHWRIEGEKIFISGGDQDLTQGTLHLVLARTGPHGMKGLSLFVCPSVLPSGERNAVRAVRIEEKMGLHASPTCQMVFDGAHAELVGELGGGLTAMFTLMNHARLDVGMQGVAHAARAYNVAAHYAAGRQQGRTRDGASATLDQHADVQRMLEEIDALALGGRGLCHFALVELERDEQPLLAEWLTPLAKVFGSEAGMRGAELGMQVLGGYGYLREYRLEQTYRDARITAIYEGANGIHGSVLVRRTLGLANGTAPAVFEAAMAGLATTPVQAAQLAPLLAAWREACAVVVAHPAPDTLGRTFLDITLQVAWCAVMLRLVAGAGEHSTPARIERAAAWVWRDVPFRVQAGCAALAAQAGVVGV